MANMATSKFSGYGLYGPTKGTNVSKFNGFGIFGPTAGLNVSKFLGYAILFTPPAPPPSKAQRLAYLRM